jgi:hypothetical protein
MSNIDFQNGFALGMASGGVVEVADTTKIDNLENLIDESGVLEGIEGSVSEKIEQLIEKAKNGSPPDVDEDGIVAFGGNAAIDNNGILIL